MLRNSWKLLSVVLMFIYIYPLKFSFLPWLPSTRVILGGLGILGIAFSIVPNSCLLIKKDLLHLYCYLILISIVTYISCLINNTEDYKFILYPISALTIIAAAYFYKSFLSRLKGKALLEGDIINAYISAVFIQSILAVVMFVNPQIKEGVLSMLQMDSLTSGFIDQSEGFRMIGFGIQFFGAGIVNIIALVFLGYKFRAINERAMRLSIIYLLLYMWILIVGTCMSRITMLGVPLSILVILSKYRNVATILLKLLKLTFLSVIIIGSILYTIVILLPVDFYAQYEDLYKWAFEIFINYSESGNLETTSTNQLLSMYEIIPDTFKTWLIGDGRWSGIVSEYYMGTDVGYFRLIFYIGIIGLIVYLLYQYKLMRIACYRNDVNMKIVFKVLFVALIILNAKGFTDMTASFALFLFTKSRFTNN